MKQKVIDTIEKYNLIQKGDSIVIGLSGGADSVCLTLILNELKDEFELTLKAVHINHKLRGAESDRDMNFCKELCETLDIPIVFCEIDVKNQALKQKQGIEEYARRVRYDSFEKECAGGKIATAHNLDDVAETLIFNIARGCSVSGITSIPEKRDNIIRPLIEVSREEIEQYLKEKNQNFVTDSTNLTDEYTRNKIRHKVIPILKEINPKFLQSVARLKESAQIQNEFICSLIDRINSEKTDCKMLADENDAVLFEYVAKLLKSKVGISPDYFHLKQCVGVIRNGGRCQLPKGFLFENENSKIVISKADEKQAEKFEFQFEKTVKTPYNKYIAQVVSYDEYKKLQNVYNLFLNNAIDYDRICHSLKLRSRRPGDRIVLPSRKVNRLLKSVYNELKIPASIRDRLAVLEENGKIIWAEGVGVAHSHSPNKNTNNVLLIKREVDYH